MSVGSKCSGGVAIIGIRACSVSFGTVREKIGIRALFSCPPGRCGKCDQTTGGPCSPYHPFYWINQPDPVHEYDVLGGGSQRAAAASLRVRESAIRLAVPYLVGSTLNIE